jgi:hypothetical protein
MYIKNGKCLSCPAKCTSCVNKDICIKCTNGFVADAMDITKCIPLTAAEGFRI